MLGRGFDPRKNLIGLKRASRAEASLPPEASLPRKRGEEASEASPPAYAGGSLRKARFNPAWLTAHVVAIAQGSYDDRAFERIPILGGALEDAGCTNGDILDHCRQPGEHVRGCWVVDFLLGKS